jgi:hypothetical protein
MTLRALFPPALARLLVAGDALIAAEAVMAHLRALDPRRLP